MFDLPAQEDTPFQPGARAPSSSPSSIRASHSSKPKSRGSAVQLPPSEGTQASKDVAGAAKAASDFFALPLQAKTEEKSADKPAFKGFGSFGSEPARTSRPCCQA